MARRPCDIHFKASLREKETFETAADREGMSVSDWIRHRLRIAAEQVGVYAAGIRPVEEKSERQ